MWQFVRTGLLLSLVLCLGVLLGWYLRGSLEGSTPLPVSRNVGQIANPLPDVHALAEAGRYDELAREVGGSITQLDAAIDGLPVQARLAAVAAFEARNGVSFDSTLYRIAQQPAGQHCDDSVEGLLSAALLVKTDAQKRLLDDRLATVTDDCAKAFIADKRFAEVDRMYEQVTLALPELSTYFLKLGQFRIRTGNFDGALAALSQIENQGELGVEARALMRQAEASDAVEAGSGEALPLKVEGAQYVVDAVIDDGPPVSLIVDTGAAMTVVDADLLQRLGYALDGPREYFATANGVVDAPVVSLRRLALGQAVINELAVGALTVKMPGQVKGLLGMNFLRHFQFRIDQDTGTLHLDPR